MCICICICIGTKAVIVHTHADTETDARTATHVVCAGAGSPERGFIVRFVSSIRDKEQTSPNPGIKAIRFNQAGLKLNSTICVYVCT